MTTMPAFLMICVPLLVLAAVAVAVLVWAGRRQDPHERVIGWGGIQRQYDAGEGDIADLELEVHVRQPVTLAGEPAEHVPSTDIASLHKSLYVGAFAGGEYGDQAIAAVVHEAERMQQWSIQQDRAERRARRWAWLPWRAYARWRRSRQVDRDPGVARAMERIRWQEETQIAFLHRLDAVEQGLQWEVDRRNGTSVSKELEYRSPVRVSQLRGILPDSVLEPFGPVPVIARRESDDV